MESALYLACSNTIPTIPKTYEFNIPTLYQLNASEQTFLLAGLDSRHFHRVLIFSSGRQLQTFFNSEIIFYDGTFDSSLPQVQQVYTMHAVYEDECERLKLYSSNNLLRYINFV